MIHQLVAYHLLVLHGNLLADPDSDLTLPYLEWLAEARYLQTCDHSGSCRLATRWAADSQAAVLGWLPDQAVVAVVMRQRLLWPS